MVEAALCECIVSCVRACSHFSQATCVTTNTAVSRCSNHEATSSHSNSFFFPSGFTSVGVLEPAHEPVGAPSEVGVSSGLTAVCVFGAQRAAWVGGWSRPVRWADPCAVDGRPSGKNDQPRTGKKEPGRGGGGRWVGGRS